MTSGTIINLSRTMLIVHSREFRPRLFAVALGLLALTKIAFAQKEAEPASYPIEDHLVPVVLNAEKDFRALLEKETLIVAEPCARMLKRPSAASEGESGVSVYATQKGTSGSHFRVTLTNAARNMWYATATNNPDPSKASVSVKRVDADIPDSTASAIFRVWNETLLRTHAYEYKGEFRQPSVSDVFEFSLIQPKAKPLYGETPFPGSNDQQPTVASLVKLGQRLCDYCDASPSDRPAMRKEIEVQANRLLKLLHDARRGRNKK